jgi:N-acetylglucosamine-6-phosphate deacetylase
VRDGVGLTLDGQALAGSTCTMIRGVANLACLVGLPLADAVRLATLNPARALGIADRCGSLAPGLNADLALLSPDLEVVATYVAGRCVYPVKEASLQQASSLDSIR